MRTLILWALFAGVVAADDFAKPPRAFHEQLPATPQQGKPWTPTTEKLSKEWRSAIAKLLEYGLADPRGCEYRKVVLAVGHVTSSGAYTLETPAFLLPPIGDDEAEDRYAVAWNGLLYPVALLGRPADLEADVAAMVERGPSKSLIVESEPSAVGIASSNPVKCALLAVYGREDLAADAVALLSEKKAIEGDPFLPLVKNWIWFHYDRAICAHLRADDGISLVSARAAQAAGVAVEKDAPLRGISRRRDAQGKLAPFVDFLDNIELLVRDQERRIAVEPSNRRIAAWQNLENPAERIKTLIGNLEYVNVTQDSQPGSVYLQFSPFVEALAQEGEAAVEPLIECLATDNRLTRSVSFGRTFDTRRHLLSVNEAAYSALTIILKTKTFGPATEHRFRPGSVEQRAEMVREIREYWRRARDLPEVEWAFSVLADDGATETQWLEAAKKLVNPVRPENRPPQPEIVRQMLPPGPAAGAALVARKSPSVSELLIRRADHVTELDSNSTRRIHHLSAACELTLLLAQWDPAAAREPIRNRLEQCRALQQDRFYKSYARRLIEPLARLLTAGILQGEDDTLKADYVEWLAELTPDMVEPSRAGAQFLPLTYLADDPQLAKAAQKAFAEADSPWRPLHEKLPMKWHELLTSPLVSVPAFQELLLEELENRAELGTVSIDHERKYLNLTAKGSRFGQSLRNEQDPELPDDAAPRPIRVCDLYAWRLSRLEGSPLFEPYWPEAKRDEANRQCAAFLQKWGRCFREHLPPESTSQFRGDPARFHLLKADCEFLSRSMLTATEQDVKEGRAIFSLDAAAANKRTVPLEMFPHMARWKTLKQFPLGAGQQKDGPEEERFDQAGYVWQAEEAMIDGEWRRFYGFVGKHIIARVPAEEVQLLDKLGDEPSLR